MKLIFLIFSAFSISSYAQKINIKPLEDFKLNVTEYISGQVSEYGGGYRIFNFKVRSGNGAPNPELVWYCGNQGQKSAINYNGIEYKFPLENLPERPPEVSRTFCNDVVGLLIDHLKVGREAQITLSYRKKEVLSIDSIEE